MNKGTAIVGFFLSFLCGMGLMWGIAQNQRLDTQEPVAANDPEKAPHATAAVPVYADDPRWGNDDAPVTIVEISDFQCPYCSKVTPTLSKIRREYGPDEVRVVWKNHPLPSHPKARPAHEAAATVHALGGDFWKFHDLVFQNQRQLSPPNLTAWAVQAGVEEKKFQTAFEAKRYAGKVDRDLAFAGKIGARSTPNFRINGKELAGALPFEHFKKIIDAELAVARKLIASGVAASSVYLERTKANHRAPTPPQPPEEDTTIWKIPVYDSDPVRGPDDALVTIVEWSDYQCPYCSRVEPTLRRVLEEYEGDVRIVWKDNPLPFHAGAKPAAYLARFAFDTRGNDAFWKAHDALFEPGVKLQEPGLQAVAEKLGLSWRDAKSAIDAGKYGAKIQESIDLARALQAPGTPAFFINGRRLKGAQPYATFEAIIEERRAAARELEKKGVPRSKLYAELMKTAQAAQ